MSTPKRKPSRKPSVLVSRQFACSHAFGGDQIINTKLSTQTNFNSAAARGDISTSSSNKPKIIWNGRDATPQPLVPSYRYQYCGGGQYDSNESVPTSLEDISLMFESLEDDNEQELQQILEKKATIPWIPIVMKELCDKFTELDEDENNDPSTFAFINDIPTIRQEDPQDTTKHDNDEKKLTVMQAHLSETGTLDIFSKPASSISTASTFYDLVKEKNEHYERACLRQRVECRNKFQERAAQTFHPYMLSRATQTETKYKSVGVGKEEDNSHKILAKTMVEDLTAAVIMTDGSLLDVSDGLRPGEREKYTVPRTATYAEICIAKAKQKFFQSKKVMDKLAILERSIQQNNYSTQQIKYRGVNIVEVDRTNKSTRTESTHIYERQSLELLFCLKCDLTSNMKVTCMSWNTSNHDVLAVGYDGSQGNSLHREGYVMLWSIRNPQFPEKQFKVSSPVTTLDFSSTKSEILAVGLYDGRVLLFDTASQRNFSMAMLDSAFSPSRHMAPVSKLKWSVDTHQGTNTEKLVSISVDGRVMQWSSKKGLSAITLITLKRTGNSLYQKGKLPNIAPGLSMDFIKDGSSYLTGSDDGSLNHCSLSYHELPLSTVKAHTGFLTSIQVSPFMNNVFMTSSSDSTVKIFSIEHKIESIHEVLSIRPTNLIGAVNDVSWSPKHSTLFAIVGQDDRIEIWDISTSSLDPVITRSQNDRGYTGKDRTQVEFSHCGDILAVGDNQGCVELHRIRAMQSKIIKSSASLEEVVKVKGRKK